VLAATTLLPALLGLMKLRVLSRKQRKQLAAERSVREAAIAYNTSVGAEIAPVRPRDAAQPTGHGAPAGPAQAGFFVRWAHRVEAKPLVKAVLAIAVMLIVALPVLSLRLGSSDAGNDPKSSTTRQAYDLLAKGFGPGSNGPLMLVAQTPGAGDQQALTHLVETLKTTPGIAEATALPTKPGETLAVVNVIPTTSPQSTQTSDLISHLRSDVIPPAEQGNTLHVMVSGMTAISEDFDSTLIAKLPMFVAIIVGLGCLLMMLAFRSVLIPLIGVAMNLLTMGVAFGSIVAVFQWGWGSEALGAGGAGPVEAFVPVIVIAILFGLSMDYQVFLISRMHEEWSHSEDNTRAVRIGHAETGQVICAAAVIMASVFASFIFGGQRMIAEFGVALALAILLDVLLLRMILVPALMHRIGRANWWLPGWLDRVIPRLNVEAADTVAPEPGQPRASVPVR
jgi:RND superfamily putative drug exporter